MMLLQKEKINKYYMTLVKGNIIQQGGEIVKLI